MSPKAAKKTAPVTHSFDHVAAAPAPVFAEAAPEPTPVSDFTEKVTVTRLARGRDAEITYKAVPACRREVNGVTRWWLQGKHVVGGQLGRGDLITEADGTKWEITKATHSQRDGLPAWLCPVIKMKR